MMNQTFFEKKRKILKIDFFFILGPLWVSQRKIWRIEEGNGWNVWQKYPFRDKDKGKRWEKSWYIEILGTLPKNASLKGTTVSICHLFDIIRRIATETHSSFGWIARSFGWNWKYPYAMSTKNWVYKHQTLRRKSYFRWKWNEIKKSPDPFTL